MSSLRQWISSDITLIIAAPYADGVWVAQWANKCHHVVRRAVFKSYVDLTQEQADNI